MLQVAVHLIVGVYFAGGVASSLCGTYFMIQIVANRKPGTPLFLSLLQSPFNLLFQPERLTERGQAARRRCLLSWVGFLVAWAGCLLFGSLTRLLS